MVVKSGFFNSVAGDRKYDASWFADYFASFIGNGVFPNPSTGLQVVEGTNMQSIVKVGKGWINGYFVVNDTDFVIQHDAADSLLNRIDRIVLQKSTADRAIKIVIKKGVLASSPVAPTVVRNADYYELALADVRISAGSIRISQSNITDQRLNKSLCGIVTGVVEQVDTTTIFNQYQSWFNNLSITKMQEFETWKTQTQQALNSWISSEQLDFEAWRNEQEGTFAAWNSQQQGNFNSWFNGIKLQLSEVEIGQHIVADFPHHFVDRTTGVTYKYGFKVDNGMLKFIYEEVL